MSSFIIRILVLLEKFVYLKILLGFHILFDWMHLRPTIWSIPRFSQTKPIHTNSSTKLPTISTTTSVHVSIETISNSTRFLHHVINDWTYFSHPTGQFIGIRSQQQDSSPDGSYSWSYETDNGISASETGQPKGTPEGQAEVVF